MTLIIILVSIVVGFGVAYVAESINYKHRQVAKNKVDQIDRYEAPNQQTIAALEAEIFGVGIEINGLPGAWWKLERGCDSTLNGTTSRDPDGFSLFLLDADSKELRNAGVGSRKLIPYNPATSRRSRIEKRTIAEIDEAVQNKMKELVEAELEQRAKEVGLKEILEKYNGKRVQDA